MTRVGIFLCTIYAIAIALCVGFAYPFGFESPALLYLPLFPQLSLLNHLDLSEQYFGWLNTLTPLEVYILIGLPTFALLYFAGWLIGGLWFHLANLMSG